LSHGTFAAAGSIIGRFQKGKKFFVGGNFLMQLDLELFFPKVAFTQSKFSDAEQLTFF